MCSCQEGGRSQLYRDRSSWAQRPFPISLYLFICKFICIVWHFPSAMPETRVRSLGRENSLEKEMATHSSILDGIIPWREEPGGLESMGLQKSCTWLFISNSDPWLLLKEQKNKQDQKLLRLNKRTKVCSLNFSYPRLMVTLKRLDSVLSGSESQFAVSKGSEGVRWGSRVCV